VHPGAVNSVPSRVQITLDIRDTDVARRDHTMAQLRARIKEIETRRRLKITEETTNADIPAVSSEHIVSMLEDICRRENITYKKMVSRAYHDSSFMARIAPIAMLFIPCRNGVSHRPDEYAKPEDIARGTQVLAAVLARLSSE
jgi:N-carbamoyl-L-amino-acid hydrolase